MSLHYCFTIFIIHNASPTRTIPWFLCSTSSTFSTLPFSKLLRSPFSSFYCKLRSLNGYFPVFRLASLLPYHPRNPNTIYRPHNCRCPPGTSSTCALSSPMVAWEGIGVAPEQQRAPRDSLSWPVTWKFFQWWIALVEGCSQSEEPKWATAHHKIATSMHL